MPEKIRLYGDITPEHETEFIFIKGALGCKSNGEALEKMIDKLSPTVRAEVARHKGARHGG